MRSILHLLAEAMARGECAALVIGGYSLEAYAVERPTKDIDLLVAAGGADAVRSLLLQAGYREAGRNSLCARFVHDNLLMIPVDLLFVNDATWEKIWLASESASIEGVPLRVPSAAHLIALKLHAMKQDPVGRDQDFSDIVRILHRRRSHIPESELRSACERFGPPGIYGKLMAALPDEP